MSIYHTIVQVLSIANAPEKGQVGALISGFSLPRKAVKATTNDVDHIKICIAGLDLVDLSLLNGYRVAKDAIIDKLIKVCSDLLEAKKVGLPLVLARAIKRSLDSADSGTMKQLVQSIDYVLSGSLKPFTQVDFLYLMRDRTYTSSYFGIKSVIPEEKKIEIYWPTKVDDFLTDALLAAITNKGYDPVLVDAGIVPEPSYGDKVYEVMTEFISLCSQPTITLRGEGKDVHNCLVFIALEGIKIAKQPKFSPYKILEDGIKVKYELKLIRLIIALMKNLPFSIGSKSIQTASGIWEEALPRVRRPKKDSPAQAYSPWGWHKLGEVTKVRKGKIVVDAPPALKEVKPVICAKAKTLALAADRYRAYFCGVKVDDTNLDNLKKTISLIVQLSQSEKKWLYTKPEQSSKILEEMALIEKVLSLRTLLGDYEPEIVCTIKGNSIPLMTRLTAELGN